MLRARCLIYSSQQLSVSQTNASSQFHLNRCVVSAFFLNSSLDRDQVRRVFKSSRRELFVNYLILKICLHLKSETSVTFECGKVPHAGLEREIRTKN